MDILPQGQLSKHFTWKEALLLPSWGVQHIPNEAEKANIVRTAEVMDTIRRLVGKPISVHCWIRPLLNNPRDQHHGDDYNDWVDGSKTSMHKLGLAVDFSAKGVSCDEIRRLLRPKVTEFEIRVEDLPGSAWVHIDLKPVSDDKLRFFKP